MAEERQGDRIQESEETGKVLYCRPTFSAPRPICALIGANREGLKRLYIRFKLADVEESVAACDFNC